MLKNGLRVVEKRGLYYVALEGQHIRGLTPWLGDAFSFLYDKIMCGSIFPKKFGADIGRHVGILRRELKDVHEKNVVELATGSGSAAGFLPSDNHYTGTDISPGLLRIAKKKMAKAGFRDARFYVADAGELPFENAGFDVCLCVLSLNFFDDADGVLGEVNRVLRPGGLFVCSAPLPERKSPRSRIRGRLYPAQQLEALCVRRGLAFRPVAETNGALFYFCGRKE